MQSTPPPVFSGVTSAVGLTPGLCSVAHATGSVLLLLCIDVPPGDTDRRGQA
jgi:hypothetical protein